MVGVGWLWGKKKNVTEQKWIENPKKLSSNVDKVPKRGHSVFNMHFRTHSELLS